MNDLDIMVAHLALMAIDDDADIDRVERWRQHWEKYIVEIMHKEHTGDCTSEPWTCSRCMYEEAEKMVPVYRKLFNL